MIFAMAALLVMEVIGLGARPPDVKDFTTVLSKELEFQIDDYKKALVGRVFVYQNPNDPNEVIRVFYRQAVIISERAKEKNGIETGGRNTNLFNLKYHSRQEAEVLGRVQKATDAFAFIREWTVHDSRTGQDVPIRQRQIWLLDSNSVWVHHIQPAGTKSALRSSVFSEPSKANPKKRINVGIRFILVDKVHIVRIDQDDLITPAKSLNEIKSEGTDNDKK